MEEYVSLQIKMKMVRILKDLYLIYLKHCGLPFRYNGFLTTILTPVIKVSKAKKIIEFYCVSDYEKWKTENNNGKGWTINIIKGWVQVHPKKLKVISVILKW